MDMYFFSSWFDIKDSLQLFSETYNLLQHHEIFMFFILIVYKKVAKMKHLYIWHIPTNTPHVFHVERTWNSRFHVLLTWNTRGVVVGMFIQHDYLAQF